MSKFWLVIFCLSAGFLSFPLACLVQGIIDELNEKMRKLKIYAHSMEVLGDSVKFLTAEGKKLMVVERSCILAFKDGVTNNPVGGKGARKAMFRPVTKGGEIELIVNLSLVDQMRDLFGREERFAF